METIKQEVDKAVATYRVARASFDREKIQLAAVQEKLEACTVAQKIAQEVSQQVQQQAHKRIADVVSRCLEVVFDEPYAFKINFEQKRGRTEASLSFERDGNDVDPMTASGGGVIDVASFALRLACLMLSRPPVNKILILDEPFKFVSAEYRDRIHTLLETLAKEMSVQFIIVTHIDELQTGKVVRL